MNGDGPRAAHPRSPARSLLRGPARLRFAVFASALALPLAALGCELILGIENIELGSPQSGCWDMTAHDGRGCYRATEANCPVEHEDPAEVHRRIINACTPAACELFTTELTKLAGQDDLPPLPQGTGGGQGGAGGGSGGMGGMSGSGGMAGAGGTAGAGGGGMGGGGAGGSGGGAPLEKCSEIIDPLLPRIYMTGSNAVVKLLRKAAPILSDPGLADPVVIIYQPQSSCFGFDAIAKNESIKGTATYYVTPEASDDVGERPCELDPDGNTVDIGTCDVFATTCNIMGLGNSVADYGSGPIQALTLVVPEKSAQKVISREAAYLVYGFGGDSEVPPWTDETHILQRDNKSGTKRMIAPAIDVSYELWKGVVLGSTSVMKGELEKANAAGQSVADATIGILDVINDDSNADYLKILAFQSERQSCGYWPDSAIGKEDKRNVRDGHYVIWGPLHFFVKASQKEPTNKTATDIVNYLTGFTPLPNEEKFARTMVSLQAKGSLIPRCAMRVDRTTELGDLKPFAPEFPCGCFFEKEVTGAAQGCTPCKQDADCDTATEICSFDFCERK